MREIRTSGSEGGGAFTGSPYPYTFFCRSAACLIYPRSSLRIGSLRTRLPVAA